MIAEAALTMLLCIAGLIAFPQVPLIVHGFPELLENVTIALHDSAEVGVLDKRVNRVDHLRVPSGN